MDCANKTCTLDWLPTWLLQDNMDVVVPVITNIVNTYLTTGVFPQAIKQAIVTLILKRSTPIGMTWKTTDQSQILVLVER